MQLYTLVASMLACHHTSAREIAKDTQPYLAALIEFDCNILLMLRPKWKHRYGIHPSSFWQREGQQRLVCSNLLKSAPTLNGFASANNARCESKDSNGSCTVPSS